MAGRISHTNQLGLLPLALFQGVAELAGERLSGAVWLSQLKRGYCHLADGGQSEATQTLQYTKQSPAKGKPAPDSKVLRSGNPGFERSG